MPTMKDVAKLSGVSIATVSRVLANHPKISAETRNKVERAMKELNYYGNAQAQLAEHSRTICFSVAKPAKEVFGSVYFDEVMVGISEQLEEAGYNLQLAISKSVEEQIEKCNRLYRERRADGFILSGIQFSDKSKLIEGFQSRGIPFVIIGRSLSHQVFSVHNDNLKDAYRTVQHLVEQQYRRIVLLNGQSNFGVVRDRTNGYLQGVQDFGLDLGDEYIVSTDGTEGSILESLQRLRDSGFSFDAVLMGESMMAPAVMKFCQMNGLRVPDDVGLIGFNEWFFLENMTPPISCVEVHGEQLGVEAVKLLLELLENPNKTDMEKNVVLSSNLLIRESSTRTR